MVLQWSTTRAGKCLQNSDAGGFRQDRDSGAENDMGSAPPRPGRGAHLVRRPLRVEEVSWCSSGRRRGQASVCRIVMLGVFGKTATAAQRTISAPHRRGQVEARIERSAVM